MTVLLNLDTFEEKVFTIDEREINWFFKKNMI
jgi:hypothetical protein